MDLYIFQDKISEIQNHLIGYLCDYADQISFVRAIKTTGGLFQKKKSVYAVELNDEQFVNVLKDLSDSFLKDIKSDKRFENQDIELDLLHHYFFKIDEKIRNKLIRSGIFVKWDDPEWYGLIYPTFYKNEQVVATTSEGSIKLIVDEIEEQRIRNSMPDIYERVET